jgi:hypothetical protein
MIGLDCHGLYDVNKKYHGLAAPDIQLFNDKKFVK